MEKMALRITIDIFSGRENPVIELTGDEAEEAIGRLDPVREIKNGETGLPSTPTLGYRGLVIEQLGEPVKGLPKKFRFAHGDMFGPDLAHRASDETFEDFVCGSTGPIGRLDLGDKFSKLLGIEIERFRDIRSEFVYKEIPRGKNWLCWSKWPWHYWLCRCRCAPIYEPYWWNDDGQIQFGNNCYNYATNYRTDSYAQPGMASGSKYTSLSSCNVASTEISAKMGAVSDGLIDVPAANNKCLKKGHLVALVIAPGNDYHWYRKDRTRRWSHKVGGSPATDRDNSGNLIYDPRTADRGGYTEFCTFMVVNHGHIKLDGPY